MYNGVLHTDLKTIRALNTIRSPHLSSSERRVAAARSLCAASVARLRSSWQQGNTRTLGLGSIIGSIGFKVQRLGFIGSV